MSITDEWRLTKLDVFCSKSIWVHGTVSRNVSIVSQCHKYTDGLQWERRKIFLGLIASEWYLEAVSEQKNISGLYPDGGLLRVSLTDVPEFFNCLAIEANCKALWTWDAKQKSITKWSHLCRRLLKWNQNPFCKSGWRYLIVGPYCQYGDSILDPDVYILHGLWLEAPETLRPSTWWANYSGKCTVSSFVLVFKKIILVHKKHEKSQKNLRFILRKSWHPSWFLFQEISSICKETCL